MAFFEWRSTRLGQCDEANFVLSWYVLDGSNAWVAWLGVRVPSIHLLEARLLCRLDQTVDPAATAARGGRAGHARASRASRAAWDGAG